MSHSLPRRLSAWIRSAVSAVTERRGVAGKIALRAGAVASLAFIVLLVHRSAYAIVMKAPDFKVPPPLAKAAVAPNWADPASGESVVTLPAGRDTLMDPELVPSVAASFSQNP